MQVNTFDATDLEFAQENLRILSGLYGLLKPLDMILPYRLEMGTRLPTRKGTDLYQFWDNKICDKLGSELKENETLVNLASSQLTKDPVLFVFPLDFLLQYQFLPTFRPYFWAN